MHAVLLIDKHNPTHRSLQRFKGKLCCLGSWRQCLSATGALSNQMHAVLLTDKHTSLLTGTSDFAKACFAALEVGGSASDSVELYGKPARLEFQKLGMVDRYRHQGSQLDGECHCFCRQVC